MNFRKISSFLLYLMIVVIMSGCQKDNEAQTYRVAISERHTGLFSFAPDRNKEEVGIIHKEKVRDCSKDDASAFLLEGSGFLLWKLQ